MSKFIQRIVQSALNLKSIPKNYTDLCVRWVGGYNKKYRNWMILGVGTVLRSIWKTRNDVCFNNKLINEPSKIVFLCCHQLESWSILQKRWEKRSWRKEAAQLERRQGRCLIELRDGRRFPRESLAKWHNECC